LGNTTLIREEIYRVNTVAFVENALRTARHTMRLIRAHPGFVLTVVLSLALGIGANTAIFSIVHGVLIQPLPYPHPDALVGIYNRLTIRGQVYEDAALSPGMYRACRNDCRVFEHVGVWSSGTATVTGAGEAEQVATVTVTHDVLPALGVPASLGRWFSPKDDSLARTAILSHGYWQRRFGGDREILDRTVVIDFVPHQIFGVMPRDFRFVDLSPDVFLTRRLDTNRAEEFSYNGIGRLKPGLGVPPNGSLSKSFLPSSWTQAHVELAPNASRTARFQATEVHRRERAWRHAPSARGSPASDFFVEIEDDRDMVRRLRIPWWRRHQREDSVA
jgi:hypothetical protein